MLIDGIILGFIVGLFRGGSFKNLLNIRVSYLWLIIPAYIIQRLGIYLFPELLFLAVPMSYLIILLIFYLNRQQYGFMIAIIGIFANFLVTLVNKGRMPVEMSLAQKLDPLEYEYLSTGTYFKHVPMSENTYLNFLGDIFYIQPPYPHTTLISLGDLLFSIGLMLFVQHSMMVNNDDDKKVGSVHASSTKA